MNDIIYICADPAPGIPEGGTVDVDKLALEYFYEVILNNFIEYLKIPREMVEYLEPRRRF